MQTPRSDIFVVMLSIALGAIVLGCLLLVLLLNSYEFQIKAAALTSPSATRLVAATLPGFGIPEIPGSVRL